MNTEIRTLLRKAVYDPNKAYYIEEDPDTPNISLFVAY